MSDRGIQRILMQERKYLKNPNKVALQFSSYHFPLGDEGIKLGLKQKSWGQANFNFTLHKKAVVLTACRGVMALIRIDHSNTKIRKQVVIRTNQLLGTCIEENNLFPSMDLLISEHLTSIPYDKIVELALYLNRISYNTISCHNVSL